MRGRTFLACITLSIASLAPPAVAGQTQRKPDKSTETGNAAPLTFDEVLEAVNAIPPARLREFLERRPIGFSPTPDQIQKLKSAGAKNDIIGLIVSKAPPPPPPPKPVQPETAGMVTLRCAPAECEIFINGQPHGHTERGVIEIHGLPVGEAVFDLKRNGFEGQQVTVALRPNTPLSRSVTLVPTMATQEHLGAALFNLLLQRLGGDQGLAGMTQLDLNGNAKLWQSNGQMTEWKTTGHLKLQSAMAYLEIEGAGLKWWASLKGSDTKSDGSGKLKGGPVALEMEKMVHQFRDFQLASLVSRIREAKMKIVAPAPAIEAGAPHTFNAIGGSDTYKFTLAADGTPQKVVLESASGLGSGMEVVYADYIPLGKGIYPKTMAIRFGDAAQHGIELRFDSVQAVPKLSDKEFHR